jgi:pimeloyl-ACP methyl ester carboxylesterase
MTLKRPHPTIVDRSSAIALAILMVIATVGGCSDAEPIATTIAATTAAATTTDATAPATAADDPTTTTESPSTLVWEPCGRVECATLTVPLDHDDPSVGTIDLAVARWPAQRPEERIGVLLYNPGGPGVPATPIMDWAADQFSWTLLDRFDVVAWDPRGVSEGAAVDCVDNPEELFLHDPTPETAEEAALIDAAVDEFVAGCVERSSALLPYVSTVSTARDMDLLRQALGEEQISYLGVSYGTALGSAYATLFPERVRAMVLDSAFDLSAPLAEWIVPRAAAEERALTLVLEQCAADSACPFHNDGDPFTAFDELMVQLDTEPLIVDGAEVGLGRAIRAVFAGLIVEEHRFWPDWSDLVRALAEAQDGNGRLLLDFDVYGSVESQLAIECLDWPRPTSEELVAMLDAVLVASSRLGPLWVEGPLVCSVWPAEPDPPPSLTAAGAGPILVVGSTGDIATPLQSSRDLADHLAEGVLLVVEANNHGAYFIGPDNLCVMETVDRYLTDLELPTDESRCILGDPQLHPPG